MSRARDIVELNESIKLEMELDEELDSFDLNRLVTVTPLNEDLTPVTFEQMSEANKFFIGAFLDRETQENFKRWNDTVKINNFEPLARLHATLVKTTKSIDFEGRDYQTPIKGTGPYQYQVINYGRKFLTLKFSSQTLLNRRNTLNNRYGLVLNEDLHITLSRNYAGFSGKQTPIDFDLKFDREVFSPGDF